MTCRRPSASGRDCGSCRPRGNRNNSAQTRKSNKSGPSRYGTRAACGLTRGQSVGIVSAIDSTMNHNSRRRSSAPRISPRDPSTPYGSQGGRAPYPVFFGPRQLPTIERARRLVGVSCAYYSNEPESMAWAERVAQWIAATGDCVWHAVAEICWADGRRDAACGCADCRPADVRRFA